MREKKFTITIFWICFLGFLNAQNIGVGTAEPDRILEVSDSGPTFLRVHTSTAFGGDAGFEMIRGSLAQNKTSWRVVNDNGKLKIASGNYKFQSGLASRFVIDKNNQFGIGTGVPTSKLHIDGGQQATLTDNGFLMLGRNGSSNLVFDQNSIQARYNGFAASMDIQDLGGNAYVSNNGGNVNTAMGDGKVGIGTTGLSEKITVQDDGFQMYLRNNETGTNDWYIGATGTGWGTGGNQLVFSPTSTSADSKFRLMDVNENNGTEAPVKITNNGNSLLFDGNEIESTGSLWINHNTNENTYINPSGGFVQMGTTATDGALTIYDETPLAIQNGGQYWRLRLFSGGDQNLSFQYRLNLAWIEYASINGISGQWSSLSNQNHKENITPMPNVLEKLKKVGIYSYNFKHDKSQAKSIGVMAQQIENQFPEVVSKVENHDGETQYGVAYGQLAMVAVKAIQEQQIIIQRLSNKIQELKSELQP